MTHHPSLSDEISDGVAARPRRLRRERRTVEVMIRMYCRAHHQPDPDRRSGDEPGDASGTDPDGVRSRTAGEATLCPACAALLAYAALRIDACRFGDHKPTCARCPVHCFRPSERAKIREVMRFSGPRMMLRHPHLAMRHLLDRHHIPAGL